MTAIDVKIVFPVISRNYQFANQTVNLGGVFPAIEIVNCDSQNGLHHFKIPKKIPHAGREMITAAVAEAERQIDHFWNVLSYVRDAPIIGTGEVMYEANGRVTPVDTGSGASMFGTATLTAVAPDGWISSRAAEFHRSYDLDLLKRLNFTRAISEPIGRFVSLYSLLASQCDDMQSKIDAIIASVDPNVEKSISPKSGNPETVFTRLRNELAHVRVSSSIIETHRSIVVHLPRFEWIVKSIVDRKIVPTP